MNNNEELKEEFLEILIKKTKGFEEKSKLAREAGSEDEANLEKIKANVIDIFLKIFNVSYNYIYGVLKNENIKNVINPEEGNYKKLLTAYLMFFDKIPAPWIEKYNKAKEHNNITEIVIEELKINTAKEVKEAFIECYNRLLD